MQDTRLYSLLALLGAVPLAAGAVALLAGSASLPIVGDVRHAVALYGLSIVCFLTGIHWATQLYESARCPFNLFAGSNAVFLVVFAAFLATPFEVSVAVLILGLLGTLVVDVKLRQVDLISAGYLKVRYAATAIACGSLLVVLLSP